jgi:hypothetical protein
MQRSGVRSPVAPLSFRALTSSEAIPGDSGPSGVVPTRSPGKRGKGAPKPATRFSASRMYISVVENDECPARCLMRRGSSPLTAIHVIPVARRSWKVTCFCRSLSAKGSQVESQSCLQWFHGGTVDWVGSAGVALAHSIRKLGAVRPRLPLVAGEPPDIERPVLEQDIVQPNRRGASVLFGQEPNADGGRIAVGRSRQGPWMRQG